MQPKEFVSKHFGQYREKGNEIQTVYCPFCNGGKNNDKYTFSVNSETGAYNCLRGTCGVKGSYRALMELYEGKSYELRTTKTVQPERKQTLAGNGLSQKSIDYLVKRGFSPNTWEKYGVTESKGNLSFPYYEKGKLVLIKYRRPEKYTGKGQKAWRDPGGKAVFWGMDLCNPEKQSILICEGEMDALAITEAGVCNVVSVPSGAEDLSCVENCWEWLEQWKEICIWPDNDKPGQEMCRKLIAKLGSHRCFVVQCEHKDANEALYKEGKEKVKEMVYTAKPVPMAGLVRLADVEAWEYEDAVRIESAMPAINQIVGGFMLGMMSVWTGINSSGKSTYLGQELIHSISQGYRVCAYSGELPAPIFRYWIDLQIAGPGNIEGKLDKIKDNTVYRVKYDQVQHIREWYKENFYLYDSLGGVSVDNLIEVFEYAAKRYNCKVFLVDNLMLMVYGESDKDFYRKQSDFVKTMKQFARIHDAHVHLVAHPRKTNGRLEKMDVLGSGDITNVADNVFSVHRVPTDETDEEGCAAYLDIFKNRISGVQDVDVALLFDDRCKRFYMLNEQKTLWTEYIKPKEKKLVLGGGIQ
jgi:twinkle protein